MSKSDHLREMRSALGCFLALLLCMALFPSTSFSFELLIGTGERGSFSHYAGKIICRSVHKFDQDVTCRRYHQTAILITSPMFRVALWIWLWLTQK